jgi:hypothetical protein
LSIGVAYTEETVFDYKEGDMKDMMFEYIFLSIVIGGITLIAIIGLVLVY